MNKIKNFLLHNKKGFFITLFIFVLIVIYYNYYTTKINYSENLLQYQDSIKSFKNDLFIKQYFEGKNIRDIFQKNCEEIISEKDGYNLLIILSDDFLCFSCIKYHLEKIDKLNKKGFPVYSIAFQKKQQLINSFIKNAIPINMAQNYVSFPFKYELITLLIDKEGIILKAEASDKNNFYKSEIFYNIVERFYKKVKM